MRARDVREDLGLEVGPDGRVVGWQEVHPLAGIYSLIPAGVSVDVHGPETTSLLRQLKSLQDRQHWVEVRSRLVQGPNGDQLEVTYRSAPHRRTGFDGQGISGSVVLDAVRTEVPAETFQVAGEFNGGRDNSYEVHDRRADGTPGSMSITSRMVREGAWFRARDREPLSGWTPGGRIYGQNVGSMFWADMDRSPFNEVESEWVAALEDGYEIQQDWRRTTGPEGDRIEVEYRIVDPYAPTRESVLDIGILAFDATGQPEPDLEPGLVRGDGPGSERGDGPGSVNGWGPGSVRGAGPGSEPVPGTGRWEIRLGPGLSEVKPGWPAGTVTGTVSGPPVQAADPVGGPNSTPEGRPVPPAQVPTPAQGRVLGQNDEGDQTPRTAPSRPSQPEEPLTYDPAKTPAGVRRLIEAEARTGLEAAQARMAELQAELARAEDRSIADPASAEAREAVELAARAALAQARLIAWQKRRILAATAQRPAPAADLDPLAPGPRWQQETVEELVPRDSHGNPLPFTDADVWGPAVNSALPQRDRNCAPTAAAHARTRYGRPTAAAPPIDDGGVPFAAAELEQEFDGRFQRLGEPRGDTLTASEVDTALQRFEDALARAGHGATGFVTYPGRPGHVIVVEYNNADDTPGHKRGVSYFNWEQGGRLRESGDDGRPRLARPDLAGKTSISAFVLDGGQNAVPISDAAGNVLGRGEGNMHLPTTAYTPQPAEYVAWLKDLAAALGSPGPGPQLAPAAPEELRILHASWESATAEMGVQVGGLGSVLKALAPAQVGLGHRVANVTRLPFGLTIAAEQPRQLRLDGLEVLLVPPSAGFATEQARLAAEVSWSREMSEQAVRAYRTWLEDRPDDRPTAIHVHDEWMTPEFIALADEFGVPIVLTVHATEAGRDAGLLNTDRERGIHALEWEMARSVDHIIVNSPAMRDEVVAVFAVPPDRITVVPNGVDLREWVSPVADLVGEDTGTLRAEWNAQAPPERQLPTDAPVLFFLGRLAEEKGVQDVIEAMPHIQEAHPGTTLVIAGDGIHRQALETQVAELGLDDHVLFVGKDIPRDGTLQRLAMAADIALIPSRYEPFGVVGLELMALGLPLVTSDVIGYVQDGQNGSRFPAGNARRLAGKVGAVLGDPDLRGHLGAEGRNTANSTKYQWENVAQETVDVYRGIDQHTRRDPGEPWSPDGQVFNHVLVRVTRADRAYEQLRLWSADGRELVPRVDDDGAYWHVPFDEHDTQVTVTVYHGDELAHQHTVEVTPGQSRNHLWLRDAPAARPVDESPLAGDESPVGPAASQPPADPSVPPRHAGGGQDPQSVPNRPSQPEGPLPYDPAKTPAGVRRLIAELEAKGYTILGTNISVRAENGVNVRLSVVARGRDGEVHFFTVRNGPRLRFSANQDIGGGFASVEESGGRFFGPKAQQMMKRFGLDAEFGPSPINVARYSAAPARTPLPGPVQPPSVPVPPATPPGHTQVGPAAQADSDATHDQGGAGRGAGELGEGRAQEEGRRRFDAELAEVEADSGVPLQLLVDVRMERLGEARRSLDGDGTQRRLAVAEHRLDEARAALAGAHNDDTVADLAPYQRAVEQAADLVAQRRAEDRAQQAHDAVTEAVHRVESMVTNRMAVEAAERQVNAARRRLSEAGVRTPSRRWQLGRAQGALDAARAVDRRAFLVLTREDGSTEKVWVRNDRGRSGYVGMDGRPVDRGAVLRRARSGMGGTVTVEALVVAGDGTPLPFSWAPAGEHSRFSSADGRTDVFAGIGSAAFAGDAPADAALGRALDSSDQIAAAVPGVAAIEQVGVGLLRVTTAGGQEFLLAVRRGELPDGLTAQTQKVGKTDDGVFVTTVAPHEQAAAERVDMFGDGRINQQLDVDWSMAATAEEVAVVAEMVDALAPVGRAVSEVTASLNQWTGQVEADQIESGLAGVRAAMRSPDPATLRAAADVLSAAGPEGEVGRAVDGLVTAARQAADRLGGEPALRPGHLVPSRLGPSDARKVAAVLIRRQRMDAPVQAELAERSRSQLERMRARRLRDTLSAAGLDRSMLHRDERFARLNNAGLEQVVQVARDFGNKPGLAANVPLTLDPRALDEMMPSLADAVGVGWIEQVDPDTDGIYRLHVGDSSFTVAVLLDGADIPAQRPDVDVAMWLEAPQDLVSARPELAARLHRLVEAYRWAHGSIEGMVEYAEEHQTPLLTPRGLGGKARANPDPTLTLDDHAAVGWLRSFQQDHPVPTLRERRTLREFLYEKGLLTSSPDYQVKQAALAAVDPDIARYVERYNTNRVTPMRLFNEAGADIARAHIPDFDASNLPALIDWLRARQLPVTLTGETVTVTTPAGDIEVGFGHDDELAPGHVQLAQGETERSYVGLMPSGTDQFRGEQAVIQLLHEVLAASPGGDPAAITALSRDAVLARLDQQIASAPSRRVRQLLERDRIAYLAQLHLADVDLATLPGVSRSDQKQARKMAKSLALDVEREFRAAIQRGEAPPTRVPGMTRYGITTVLTQGGIGAVNAGVGVQVSDSSLANASWGIWFGLAEAWAYAIQYQRTDAGAEARERAQLEGGPPASGDLADDVTAEFLRLLEPLAEGLIAANTLEPATAGDAAAVWSARSPDLTSGTTSFKYQLTANLRLTAWTAARSIVHLGMVNQLPALAITGATTAVAQLFLKTIGDRMLVSSRVANRVGLAAFEAADELRQGRQAQAARTRQLMSGVRTLAERAGTPVPQDVLWATRRELADSRWSRPVATRRPNIMPTYQQWLRYQLFETFTPSVIGASVGLTPWVNDPVVAALQLGSGVVNTATSPGVGSFYHNRSENAMFRRTGQLKGAADTSSRREFDQGVRLIYDILSSKLSGTSTARQPIPGERLPGDVVLPAPPESVMPTKMQAFGGTGVVPAMFELPVQMAMGVAAAYLTGQATPWRTIGVAGAQTVIGNIAGPAGMWPLNLKKSELQALQEFYRQLIRQVTAEAANLAALERLGRPDQSPGRPDQGPGRPDEGTLAGDLQEATEVSPEDIELFSEYLEQWMRRAAERNTDLTDAEIQAMKADLARMADAARMAAEGDRDGLTDSDRAEALAEARADLAVAQQQMHELQVELGRAEERSIADPASETAREAVQLAINAVYAQARRIAWLERRVTALTASRPDPGTDPDPFAPGPSWQQRIVEHLVPRDPNGNPLRFTNPDVYGPAVNDDFPGRDLNCAPTAFGQWKTWYGEPTAAAPPIDDSGVPFGATELARRTKGQSYRLVDPQGDTLTAEEVGTGLGDLEAALTSAGHGSSAFVIYQHPRDAATGRRPPGHVILAVYNNAPDVPEHLRGVSYFNWEQGGRLLAPNADGGHPRLARPDLAGKVTGLSAMAYDPDKNAVQIPDAAGNILPPGVGSMRVPSPTQEPLPEEYIHWLKGVTTAFGRTAPTLLSPELLRVLHAAWETSIKGWGELVGGMGSVLLGLLPAMVLLGHDVTHITRQGFDDPLNALDELVQKERDGLNLLLVPPAEGFSTEQERLAHEVLWSLAISEKAVDAYLKQLEDNPDMSPAVIHAHDEWMTPEFFDLADELGIPIVLTVHATEVSRQGGLLDTPTKRGIHALEWSLVRRADHIIVNSPPMRDEVAALFAVPLDRITVVPNGVDLQEWVDPVTELVGRDTGDLRREWNEQVREKKRQREEQRPEERQPEEQLQQLPEDAPVLFFVGRLAEAKGLQDLIAALPEIHQTHPGTTVAVAGDGDYRRIVEAQVAELGLGDYVKFFGGGLSRVDGTMQRLALASDVSVIPSRNEAFGVVGLEVWALGLPLVASDAITYVQDRQNALRYPAGDTGALAEQVGTILGDPELRARLAQQGHDTATGPTYKWKNIAQKTTGVYHSVSGHVERDPGAPWSPDQNAFNHVMVRVTRADGAYDQLRIRLADGRELAPIVDGDGAFWHVPFGEHDTRVTVTVFDGAELLYRHTVEVTPGRSRNHLRLGDDPSAHPVEEFSLAGGESRDNLDHPGPAAAGGQAPGGPNLHPIQALSQVAPAVEPGTLDADELLTEDVSTDQVRAATRQAQVDNALAASRDVRAFVHHRQYVARQNNLAEIELLANALDEQAAATDRNDPEQAESLRQAAQRLADAYNDVAARTVVEGSSPALPSVASVDPTAGTRTEPIFGRLRLEIEQAWQRLGVEPSPPETLQQWARESHFDQMVLLHRVDGAVEVLERVLESGHAARSPQRLELAEAAVREAIAVYNRAVHDVHIPAYLHEPAGSMQPAAVPVQPPARSAPPARPPAGPAADQRVNADDLLNGKVTTDQVRAAVREGQTANAIEAVSDRDSGVTYRERDARNRVLANLERAVDYFEELAARTDRGDAYQRAVLDNAARDLAADVNRLLPVPPVGISSPILPPVPSADAAGGGRAAEAFGQLQVRVEQAWIVLGSDPDHPGLPGQMALLHEVEVAATALHDMVQRADAPRRTQRWEQGIGEVRELIEAFNARQGELRIPLRLAVPDVGQDFAGQDAVGPGAVGQGSVGQDSRDGPGVLVENAESVVVEAEDKLAGLQETVESQIEEVLTAAGRQPVVLISDTLDQINEIARVARSEVERIQAEAWEGFNDVLAGASPQADERTRQDPAGEAATDAAEEEGGLPDHDMTELVARGEEIEVAASETEGMLDRLERETRRRIADMAIPGSGARLRGVSTIEVGSGAQNDPLLNRWTLDGSPPEVSPGQGPAPDPTIRGWEPDTIYRIMNADTGSVQLFHTDSDFRVVRVEGPLLQANGRRDVTQEGYSGGADRTSEDVAAQIIPGDLGGLGDGINYQPVNSALHESGQWWQLQKVWRDATAEGYRVGVVVEPQYLGRSERPDLFNVSYTMTAPDGTRTYTQARRPGGGAHRTDADNEFVFGPITNSAHALPPPGPDDPQRGPASPLPPPVALQDVAPPGSVRIPDAGEPGERKKLSIFEAVTGSRPAGEDTEVLEGPVDPDDMDTGGPDGIGRGRDDLRRRFEAPGTRWWGRNMIVRELGPDGRVDRVRATLREWHEPRSLPGGVLNRAGTLQTALGFKSGSNGPVVGAQIHPLGGIYGLLPSEVSVDTADPEITALLWRLGAWVEAGIPVTVEVERVPGPDSDQVRITYSTPASSTAPVSLLLQTTPAPLRTTETYLIAGEFSGGRPNQVREYGPPGERPDRRTMTVREVLPETPAEARLRERGEEPPGGWTRGSRLFPGGVEQVFPASVDWAPYDAVEAEWIAAIEQGREIALDWQRLPLAEGDRLQVTYSITDPLTGRVLAGRRRLAFDAVPEGTQEPAKAPEPQQPRGNPVFWFSGNDGKPTVVQARLSAKLPPRSTTAAEKRAMAAAREGARPGDKVFRLLPPRFYRNADADPDNMVPINEQLARGPWRRMQNEWGRHVRKGHVVEVTIAVHPGQGRPESFVVNYTILGRQGQPLRTGVQRFANAGGQAFVPSQAAVGDVSRRSGHDSNRDTDHDSDRGARPDEPGLFEPAPGSLGRGQDATSGMGMGIGPLDQVTQGPAPATERQAAVRQALTDGLEDIQVWIGAEVGEVELLPSDGRTQVAIVRPLEDGRQPFKLVATVGEVPGGQPVAITMDREQRTVHLTVSGTLPTRANGLLVKANLAYVLGAANNYDWLGSVNPDSLGIVLDPRAVFEPAGRDGIRPADVPFLSSRDHGRLASVRYLGRTYEATKGRFARHLLTAALRDLGILRGQPDAAWRINLLPISDQALLTKVVEALPPAGDIHRPGRVYFIRGPVKTILTTLTPAAAAGALTVNPWAAAIAVIPVLVQAAVQAHTDQAFDVAGAYAEKHVVRPRHGQLENRLFGSASSSDPNVEYVPPSVREYYQKWFLPGFAGLGAAAVASMAWVTVPGLFLLYGWMTTIHPHVDRWIQTRRGMDRARRDSELADQQVRQDRFIQALSEYLFEQGNRLRAATGLRNDMLSAPPGRPSDDPDQAVKLGMTEALDLAPALRPLGGLLQDHIFFLAFQLHGFGTELIMQGHQNRLDDELVVSDLGEALHRSNSRVAQDLAGVLEELAAFTAEVERDAGLDPAAHDTRRTERKPEVLPPPPPGSRPDPTVPAGRFAAYGVFPAGLALLTGAFLGVGIVAPGAFPTAVLVAAITQALGVPLSKWYDKGAGRWAVDNAKRSMGSQATDRDYVAENVAAVKYYVGLLRYRWERSQALPPGSDPAADPAGDPAMANAGPDPGPATLQVDDLADGRVSTDQVRAAVREAQVTNAVEAVGQARADNRFRERTEYHRRLKEIERLADTLDEAAELADLSEPDQAQELDRARQDLAASVNRFAGVLNPGLDPGGRPSLAAVDPASGGRAEGPIGRLEIEVGQATVRLYNTPDQHGRAEQVVLLEQVVRAMDVYRRVADHAGAGPASDELVRLAEEELNQAIKAHNERLGRLGIPGALSPVSDDVAGPAGGPTNTVAGPTSTGPTSTGPTSAGPAELRRLGADRAGDGRADVHAGRAVGDAASDSDTPSGKPTSAQDDTAEHSSEDNVRANPVAERGVPPESDAPVPTTDVHPSHRVHNVRQPALSQDYRTDVPRTANERYFVRDKANPVPLFDGPPRREQTAQGVLDDCGLVAVIGAVAGHRPDIIQNMIRQVGDGMYEVTLHQAAPTGPDRRRIRPTGRTVTYRMDDQIPVVSKDPERPPAGMRADTCVWPALVEKAIAAQDQTWGPEERADRSPWVLVPRHVVEAERDQVQLGPSPAEEPTGYTRLDFGQSPYVRATLLAELTGAEAEIREIPGEERGAQALLDEFQAKLSDGKPVIVATRRQRAHEPNPHPGVFVFGHAYEVVKIEGDQIHVRNPWGIDASGNPTDPPPMDVQTFREYYLTGVYVTLSDGAEGLAPRESSPTDPAADTGKAREPETDDRPGTEHDSEQVEGSVPLEEAELAAGLQLAPQPDFGQNSELGYADLERYLVRDPANPVPLHAGRPSREQAMQGLIQDCGVIATFGAVAGHRPDIIEDLIQPAGDGLYQVSLHGIPRGRWESGVWRVSPLSGPKMTFLIDDQIPVAHYRHWHPDGLIGARANTDIGAWAALLEKAVATDVRWEEWRKAEFDGLWRQALKLGTDEKRLAAGLEPLDTPMGYDRLHQGIGGFELPALMAELTGMPAEARPIRDGVGGQRTITDQFTAQLLDGKPIVVSSRPPRDGERNPFLAEGNHFYFGHAYEVIKVEGDKIHLRNPMGSDPLGRSTDPPPLDSETFLNYFLSYYVTLSGGARRPAVSGPGLAAPQPSDVQPILDAYRREPGSSARGLIDGLSDGDKTKPEGLGIKGRIAQAILDNPELPGQALAGKATHVQEVEVRAAGTVNQELSRSFPDRPPSGVRSLGLDAARYTSSKWRPNTVYRVRNADIDAEQTFRTDHLGRVVRAEAQLVPAQAQPDMFQASYAGGADRLPTDVGGHLIPTGLGGPREGINLVPMDADIQEIRWKDQENVFKTMLEMGREIHLVVEPQYAGDSARPHAFSYSHTSPRKGAVATKRDWRSEHLDNRPPAAESGPTKTPATSPKRQGLGLTWRPRNRTHNVRQPEMTQDYQASAVPTVSERLCDRSFKPYTVPLFDGPPNRAQVASDVRPICVLTATMGAAAGHRPDIIQRIIRQVGHGRYKVKLHEVTLHEAEAVMPVLMSVRPTGRTVTYKMDDLVPVVADAPTRPIAGIRADTCAWPALLEKALAAQDQTFGPDAYADRVSLGDLGRFALDLERRQAGLGRSSTDPPTGYDRLDFSSSLKHSAIFLAETMGAEAEVRQIPRLGRGEQALIDEFGAKLADRKPIIVNTRSQRIDEPSPDPGRLEFLHAYEVTKVEGDQIHVRNPWGIDGSGNSTDPPPMDVPTFWEYFLYRDDARIGDYATLSDGR